MKAVQKYGPNYELIADEIKTRSKSQVKYRLKWLLKQVKADKSHPDCATLLVFDKKRLINPNWTRKETEMLMKAVTKYGKDYQMISNAVKTRKVQQCRAKMLGMFKQIASDPKHLNFKYAKILKKLSFTVWHVWTD